MQTGILKMMKTLVILIIVLALLPLMPRIFTYLYAKGHIYNEEDTPPKPVAIVFGAGLWRDGTPTPVLKDRVETAAKLYHNGIVDKILMSGDNRFIEYNEPGAMREYALTLGVKEEDIILDYAGRRTYDTCYRARDIFMLKEALLVTQAFHLDRALFICRSLGIDAIGVPAQNRAYRTGSLLYWNIREILATLIAFWEVFISHPVPVLGSPEPIFPPETDIPD